MKTCTRCKTKKSLADFYKQTSSKDGKMSRCKKCCAEYNKEWAAKNPERAKERWRIAEKKSRNNPARRARKFGITVDELNIWLSVDNCQICGNQFKSGQNKHIDHCHVTGKVRGVLCTNCNTGIGNLRDSAELLKKAIQYLNNASGPTCGSKSLGYH